MRSFTLEELLDDEELFHEIKFNNMSLVSRSPALRVAAAPLTRCACGQIDYLCQPQTVKRLIEMVVMRPEEATGPKSRRARAATLRH